MSNRRLDTRERDAADLTDSLVARPTVPARPGTPARMPAGRVLVFTVLCLACVMVAGAYALQAARRSDSVAQRAAREPAAAKETLAALAAGPHLVFLQTDGDAYRRVALSPLDPAAGEAQLTELQCQRVYVAAGQGLCVGKNSVYGGSAFLFDAEFRVRASLSANGIPSRARISPDGRYGTITLFVQGHSYADGGFSTQTTLIDMAAGAKIADLEDFTVLREGERWRSADFNFWGVTFATDSNRFYATLGTGGKTYLVEGDIVARQVRVLRDNVECPSLSPNNTRIVFKKRMPSEGRRVVWQLHALDLATMAETPLAETRSVDDQAEWLDNATVIYSLPDDGPPATIRPDLWAVPADGSGAPRLLATRAMSPAVVH